MKRWALAAVIILMAAATIAVTFPADARSGGEGNQNLQSNACTSHNVQGSNTVTLAASKTAPSAGEQLTVTVTVSGSQGTADKMGVMLTTAASGTSGTLPTDKGWVMVTDPSGTKYNYVERSGYSGSMTFTWTMKAPSTAGSYTFYAKAFYGSQRYIKVSSALTLTVAAAAINPPTVSITAPANGATVSGTMSVSVTATPASGQVISSVDLKLDGVSLGAKTTSPYTWSVDTTGYSNGQHTIQATATDGGARSSSQQTSVTVSNTVPAPTVSITAPANGATLSGNSTVSATVTGQASITSVQLKVDSTIIATDSTSPYGFTLNTYSLSKGSHTLTIIATDANTRTGTASISVIINNDPTTISFTTPANGAAVSGAMAVSASTAAAYGRTVQSLTLSIDGVIHGTDTTAPYGWSVDTLLLSNGAHQLQLSALDSGGDIAATQISVTVNNQGIAVAFTAPAEGSILSDAVSVSASASGAGLSAVTLLLDGFELGTRTAPPFSWHLDTSSYADGGHVLNLTAADSQGRKEYAQIQVTFSNSGPQVAIATPADGSGVNGIVNVAATVVSTRPVSYVVFLLDGETAGNSSAAPYTWTFNAGSMTDGAHSVMVKAVDSTARSGQRSIQIMVRNPIPVVGVSSPGDGAIIKGTVSVNGNASSAQGIAFVEFYVDGVKLGNRSIAPYVWSLLTTAFSDGQHVLELRARSLLGLSASAQVMVIVQNTASEVAVPVIAIHSPTSGQSVQGRFTLLANITSADPLLYITLRIDDTLFDMRSGPPYAWEVDSNRLSDGQHVFAVTAVTTEGGMGVKSVGASVANSAPQLTVQGVQEGATLSGTADLYLNASSSNLIDEMYVWMDSDLLGLFRSGSGHLSIDTNALTEGAHVLDATVKDIYGRIARLEICFQVRNGAPTIYLAAPGDGSRSYGTLDIQVDVACPRPVQVTLRINDLVLGSAATPPYRFRVDSNLLSKGAHIITAIANDAYGKTARAQISIIVDNGAPSLSMPGLTNNPVFSGDILLVPDISAPNGVQSLWLNIDGVEAYTATQAPYQYLMATDAMANGPHVVTLELVDRNDKRCEMTTVFVVLNLPPRVTVPSLGEAIYGQVAMTATIAGDTDMMNSWVEVDGAFLTIIPAEGVFILDTKQFSDGTHNMVITAEDAHGRRGYAEIDFTVANAGPVVSVLTPTAEGEVTMNSTVTLAIASHWPIASVQVWVDGERLAELSAEPWSLPLDISAMAEGTHILMASAIDAIGRRGEATISFASRIMLPQLEMGEPTGSSGMVEIPLISNMPLSYVLYYLNGVELENSSAAPFTCSIDTSGYEDGARVLNATAVLNDGTVIQLSREVQFLNSAKAPAANMVLDLKDLDLIFLQVLIIVLLLAVVLGKARKRK